jgi:hypothetical protein
MRRQGGRKTQRSSNAAAGEGDGRGLPLDGSASAVLRDEDLVFEDDFGDEVVADEAEGEVTEAQHVYAEHPSQLPQEEAEIVAPLKVRRA